MEDPASVPDRGDAPRLDDPATSLSSSSAPRSLYGSVFWIAFVANFLLTTANSLSFRFADFVDFLRGTASDTGLIVGVGTGAGIMLRLWLGRVIDVRGPRYVWAGSAAASVVGSLAFLAVDSLGPTIYAARIVYTCGIAGMFSCSVFHLCTDVPIERRAELVGTLGVSGFLGMMIGPRLGDWMFESSPTGATRFVLLFSTAAAMIFVYFWMVLYLTRHSTRPAPHEPPALARVLVQYWPGWIVAVAMMMGMALVVPTTFLTRFRDDRGLSGLATFFWFYAPTAILMRVFGRHLPERMGRRTAALIGMGFLASSMIMYLWIDSDWQLAFPALAAGTGHALLFPSVTTLGADAFPERHRATGTTLILGFLDFGMMWGAPVLGAVIDRWGFDAMFAVSTAAIVAATIGFAAASWLRSRRDAQAAESAEVAGEHELGEW
jgi:MFS family permease